MPSPRERYDAVFGGGRRDEERARAKERVFSMRDEFGQWEPRNQRPELWSLYNGRHLPGEHVRVFPLSNWTELDVWDYIEAEKIDAADDLLRPRREVVFRDGMWIAINDGHAVNGRRDAAEIRSVRYRTVGDMSCTAAVCPAPARFSDVINEVGADQAHRARRDPRRRPAVRGRHGGPQAGGLLLMPQRSAVHSSARTVAGGRTLLRLATAGSVDDGKSTLVGRLLLDTNSVLADTLDHVEQVSQAQRSGRADLALLTDGLRAEREQGITIDVAYRYFATPARKFILADCPGHVQYTRNTVTGSSTADVIVLLVDARNGRGRADPPPPRGGRRCCACRMSCLSVNKIDLVDYSEDVFTAIATDFALLAGASAYSTTVLHPGLRDRGRQRGDPIASHSLVRRADRTRAIWRTSTTPGSRSARSSASRCNTSYGPSRQPRRHGPLAHRR